MVGAVLPPHPAVAPDEAINDLPGVGWWWTDGLCRCALPVFKAWRVHKRAKPENPYATLVCALKRCENRMRVVRKGTRRVVVMWMHSILLTGDTHKGWSTIAMWCW